jgi:hypothetical protein
VAKLVLRLRLVGGDQMDVTVEDAETDDDEALLEHVVATLAQDSGALRSKHGERLTVVFGRGVASFEVSPRGAVL